MNYFNEQILAVRADFQEILDNKVKELKRLKARSAEFKYLSLEAAAVRGLIDGLNLCLSAYSDYEAKLAAKSSPKLLTLKH